MSKTLPPLPEVMREHLSYFTNDAQQELTASIESYALAAIEAQGVPEGWRELMSEALDNALASTVEDGISPDRRNYRRELAQRLKQALDASATPAPQAAVGQQEPFAFVQVGKVCNEAMKLCRPEVQEDEHWSSPIAVYTTPDQQEKHLLAERIAELERELAIERAISFRNQVAELEQQLSEARKQMEAQKEEWFSWESKRKALEQDAERYQLLRRGQHWSVIDYIGDSLRADVLDAAIDAAMQKGKT